MDHDIGYRALENGSIDVIDLYATDAEIDYYKLKSLKDDLLYFPEYYSVFLYREELLEKAPEAINALASLRGELHQVDDHHWLARHTLPGDESQTVEIHYLVYNIYAGE